ncbi:hypothetical protein R1sor_001712 [Riccia sorocarpa]|uniref:Endonuclease/exonuclease/phosphatase domain-containing protein n=1 Tax=Riccia sorocarpa TaxID=122646 RepID=A0ABD3GZW3_9MARC
MKELKVIDKPKLEARLKAIVPGAHIIMDYTASGRDGAALLIPLSFQVLETGTSDTGLAAWAKINTSVEEIKVISVHTPNTIEERTVCWEQMYTHLATDRCILTGDFNMVELWEDCRGKSTMIQGSESRAWKSLAADKELVDAYICAAERKGGLFTRHAICDSDMMGPESTPGTPKDVGSWLG